MYKGGVICRILYSTHVFAWNYNVNFLTSQRTWLVIGVIISIIIITYHWQCYTVMKNMNPTVVTICLTYNLNLWESYIILYWYPYSVITGTGIGVRVKPKKWDKSLTTASFEELSVFVIESNTYALKVNKKLNSQRFKGDNNIHSLAWCNSNKNPVPYVSVK